jgi:hypothetical protein
MKIIIANKFYSKNKYNLNEIYLILLKTRLKLHYVCYALKYIFVSIIFVSIFYFRQHSGVAFYA